MNNSQHINNTQTPDNTLVRKDVAENTDISNARITIWKVHGKYLNKLAYRSLSENVVSYAQSIIPDGYIAKVGIAIHNAYLNVLTSTGILGIIPFMAFNKEFVLNVYRIIYNKCIGKDYHFVYCLVILSYALYAALNNELVYENTVGTFVLAILGRVNSKIILAILVINFILKRGENVELLDYRWRRLHWLDARELSRKRKQCSCDR